MQPARFEGIPHTSTIPNRQKEPNCSFLRRIFRLFGSVICYFQTTPTATINNKVQVLASSLDTTVPTKKKISESDLKVSTSQHAISHLYDTTLVEFFTVIASILEKYDCHCTAEMKVFYSPSQFLTVAYNAIMLKLFKMGGSKPIDALAELYFHLNIEPRRLKRNSFALNLLNSCFIKVIHSYGLHSKLPEICIDLDKLSKFLHISMECILVDPRTTIEQRLTLLNYFSQFCHDNITILKINIHCSFVTINKIILTGLGLVRLGKKNGAVQEEWRHLGRHLLSLERFINRRLDDLEKHRFQHSTSSSNSIVSAREFLSIVSQLSQAAGYRIHTISIIIFHLQLSTLDPSKDKNTIHLYLHINRCNFFNTLMPQIARALSNGIEELAKDLVKDGIDQHRCDIHSQNFFSLLHQALHLIELIFLASNTNEKNERLHQLSGWHKSVIDTYSDHPYLCQALHGISKVTQQICEQATKEVMRYKAVLMDKTPKPLLELLEVPVIKKIISRIKEFTSTEYCSAVNLLHFLKNLEINLRRVPSQSFPHEYFASFGTFLLEMASSEKSIKSRLESLLQTCLQMEYIPMEFFKELLACSNDLFVRGSRPVYSNLDMLQDRVGAIFMAIESLREPLASFLEMPLLTHPEYDPFQESSDAWLDELEREEEFQSTHESRSLAVLDIEEEQDEKMQNESQEPQDCSAIEFGALPTALPSVLPPTVSGSIELFIGMINRLYRLPEPMALPFEAQKFSSQAANLTLRQQNFAMRCLQRVVDLRLIVVSTEQRSMMTSLFFLWHHQVLEQGLTHLYAKQNSQEKKTPSHKIAELLRSLKLNEDKIAVSENNDATHYFRYPFALSLTKKPLALQHIVDNSLHVLDTPINVITWLREMISIIDAAITTYKPTNDAVSQFSYDVQRLLSHMAALEGSEKLDLPPLESNLNRDQKWKVKEKSKDVHLSIDYVQEKISHMSHWEPHFRFKIALLKTIVHHLKCLEISLNIFIEQPLRQFLFLYAIIQQIAVQYVAENIGRWLSMVSNQTMHTHDLMEYCRLFHLDSELTDVQKKTLEALNLRKGSEYLYKRFVKAEEKVPHSKMKWLSNLYGQANLESGFATQKQKSINTVTLQTQVYEHGLAVSDIAIALVRNKL